MSAYVPLDLTVWGEFACFTRPENKVERVSYPVMTPSAARGILEAILWKPQFDWRVKEIHVLDGRPAAVRELASAAQAAGSDQQEELAQSAFQWFSILRNEINSRQSSRAAAGDPSKAGHYLADEDRAQRHTLALRHVRYRIIADVELRSGALARLDDAREKPSVEKYRDMFRRRVQSGQCFQQPFLGCREFAAHFSASDPAEEPLPLDARLGPMLFDLRFRHNSEGRGIGAEPVFFDAVLEHGVLRVPQELYAQTIPEGAHAA